MMILSQLMTTNTSHIYLKQAAIFILAVLVLLSCNITQASIAIGLTRAIVTGSDNTGSVQILNESSQPALIQSWIDNNISEMDKPPESIQVPFVIDLPVFRLEGRTDRRIRIFYTGKGKALPSDRESLFWLNVLEIPPKSTAKTVSEVQIAFHSRIKLFYRPQAISSHAENLEQQLIFKRLSDNKLQVTNPTPFHITFMSLETVDEKTTTKTRLSIGSDDMIAPKSTITIPLNSAKNSLDNRLKILFSIIDDFGTTVRGETAL